MESPTHFPQNICVHNIYLSPLWPRFFYPFCTFAFAIIIIHVFNYERSFVLSFSLLSLSIFFCMPHTPPGLLLCFARHIIFCKLQWHWMSVRLWIHERADICSCEKLDVNDVHAISYFWWGYPYNCLSFNMHVQRWQQTDVGIQNNNNNNGIDGRDDSFLNSCVNPVALYCVSGVFRQHFHRYLCCKPIQPTHHRLGLSLATNACDTSFMSTIRRPHHNHHTIVHNGSSPTHSIIMSEKRWGTILSQDTFL